MAHNSLKNIARLIIITVFLSVGALRATALGPLIHSASQLSANCSDRDEGQHIEYLVDGNPSTFWHANWHAEDYQGLWGYCIYINDIGEFSGTNTFTIKMQRRANINTNHVKEFYVDVFDLDAQTWVGVDNNVASFNFFYNHDKEGEIEYSNPIVINRRFNAMRLVIKRTWSSVYNGDTRTDVYADGMNITFHLAELQIYHVNTPAGLPDISTLSDMKITNPDMNGFTLRHTQGVLDEENHGSDALKDWYSDWAGARSGNWTSADVLAASNIEMPNYSYLTAADDPRITSGVRQRTHVTEHTVYAIPGRTLNLLPFSDFATQNNYFLDLSRWYDYATDGVCTDLYYPFKPQSVHRTSFGDLCGWRLDKCYNDARFANVPAFWVPEGQFRERYIALDGYQVCQKGTNILENEFVEPNIAFRHIFHIKDGVEFAKEFSGSVAANESYVKKNIRVVSARAGAAFQIRFDNPMPTEQYVPMNLYYLDNDNRVLPVFRPLIEVTAPDGTVTTDNSVFYPTESYVGRGGLWRDDNNNLYKVGEADRWYSRFMNCNAEKAQEGTYRIRLLVRDAGGNLVNVRGSSTPLVLAEYQVTFMPGESAVLLSQDQLATDTYKHCRTEYIENELGLKSPQAKVDFDEYIGIRDLPDYMQTGATGHHRFKWPRAWEGSTYAYGFNSYFDYNMYLVCDHSDMTPYHGQPDNNMTSDMNFGQGKGLYDRKFYDTKGQEKGYFYYVNASSDPGVMATMKIDNLCSGSTLFVNGWLSEFSGGEIENVILNFVAVKKKEYGGETVNIHSFVSGYLPNTTETPLGRWMYFYYSFVPNFDLLGISSDQIDHYELMLENNCRNSGGADYAIDDIRVYVAKPRLYARQTVPICAGGNETTVKVETPFEVIMSTLGRLPGTEASNQDVDFYYTFLLKSTFDRYFNDPQRTYQEAFDAAVLHYDYNGTGAPNQTFGHVVFNTHYESNTPFEDDQWTLVDDRVRREVIQGERYLVFNTNPKDVDLVVGDEYIMAIYADDSGTVTSPTANDFDITSECAKTCTFTIHSSGVAKIDGVPVPDMSNIIVCENQWPVVQIDIYGMKDSESQFGQPEMDLLERNAIMDWYDGSIAQFNKEQYTDPETGKSIFLYDAIANFRSVADYKELSDVNQPLKGLYDDISRKCLIHYTTPVSGRSPLQIYQASYVFPSLKVPTGQINMFVYATAIPINRYSVGSDVKVCTEPSEIRVIIANKSPLLKHGINNSEMDYPSWMDDVPLRVGLRQLKAVSGDMDTHPDMLCVPLRWTEAVTPGVVRLLQKTDDDLVYLVETDDPAYKDLSVPADNPTGLRSVGRLRDLTAIVDGDKTNNHAMIAFSDRFTFHEGYYYRLRFNYQEDRYNPSQSICDGQDVFTIKVVAEYQKWTGEAGNLSFNNDRNWSRVTSADIHRADDPADEFTLDARTGEPGFTPQRVNTNKFSYAPLHFTKTLVPASATSPHLSAPGKKDINVYSENAFHTHSWDNVPEADATDYVIYDMVGKHLSDGKSVGCFPWQANTCNQIHFGTGGQINGQQHLVYEKAWVDVRLRAGKWYTLASPLGGVVAGDMYAPSATGQQLTELYKDITYSTTLNHRFRPAVYQRCWNAAQATVYELPGSATSQRNVAVRTTWSNVYNDVAVPYAPAQGFSIKADVSALGAAAPDSVLMRLPKADTEYNYYTQDYEAGGSGQMSPTATPVNRNGAHRLNPVNGRITVTGAAAGKYFMVGNPFMTHLDVHKFISANSGLIQNKYYIMNGDGIRDVLLNADGTSSSVGSDGTPELIAPMQSFFVEAINPATSITLTYDQTMMATPAVAPGSSPLKAPRARGDEQSAAISPAGLTVTAAGADGVAGSQALVRVSATASAEYRDDEDMAMLMDGTDPTRTRVFTLAGNTAATINTLDAVRKVELCVLTEEQNTTVLTFNGTDMCGSDLMLYDAAAATSTPITDGMTYEVEGPAFSRLFITAGDIETETISTISVSTRGHAVTVTAAYTDSPLDVEVFDTMGRNIFSGNAGSTGTLTFNLQQDGIYIVNATSGEQKLTKKIVIR